MSVTCGRAQGFARALFCAVAALASLAGTAEAHVRSHHHGGGRLQCAPYAREVSGIAIRGNAGTWWNQARGIYERGDAPERGSVLAFKSTGAMPLGHVAVVSKVIDARHVLLNHANWSGHGDIQRSALAVDVSDAGDWSQVRVWHAGSGALGTRVNPTYGFIYASAAKRDRGVQLAMKD